MTEHTEGRPTPKEEIHRGGRHNIWRDKGLGFQFKREDLENAIKKQDKSGKQSEFLPSARQQTSEDQR
jgi:hypothetical protein